MRISAAIKQAVTAMRRDTFLTETDWLGILNSVVMEFADTTDSLIGDFTIELVEGVAEYKLTDPDVGTLMRIIEDPSYGTTSVPRVQRHDLVKAVGVDLTTATGAPQYVYQVDSFTLGIYPVPGAAENSQALRVYGVYYPVEITEQTSTGNELPFEQVDHPTLVMGMLVHAERIDRDWQVSQVVKNEWERGKQSARGRARRRLPGTSRVRRGR